jgi:hypothetical protein
MHIHTGHESLIEIDFFLFAPHFMAGISNKWDFWMELR